MGGKRVAPTAGQIAMLRDHSDRFMSREFGASANTWSRIRAKHGIPPFRHPTTKGGIPTPWVAKPAKSVRSVDEMATFYRTPLPKRDHSLIGEAMAHLQRERFTCFSRKKVLGSEGYQVGGMVLDAPALLDMAKRRGFKPEPWMGGL